MLLLGLMLFLQSGMEIAVGGWTSTYAREALLLSGRVALFFRSLYWLGIMLARLVLGAPLKPVLTLAFVPVVWMTILTVAELLVERGVMLHIHPSHNIPGDTTAQDRLDRALAEYKRRAGF